MLTNLGEWAAARAARPAYDITVTTDWADRAWTVLSRPIASPERPIIMGWVYHLGADFEVTSAGDPIRIAHTSSFEDALAFLMVDVASAGRARSSIRGVG
jgi:hypothetical protein